MSKLFISPRREDWADICGRLNDKLAAHFGRDNVWKTSKGGWDQKKGRLGARYAYGGK